MKILKFTKLKLIGVLILIASGIFQPEKVRAEELCGVLPCSVAPVCLFGFQCNGNALSIVGSIVQFALSFIFVGIVAYGVYLIVQAALKIIRSNGDSEQIQSGMKLVKGAYTGIILIFVGIIGLVVVFAIFSATDIFRVQDPETPPGVILE